MLCIYLFLFRAIVFIAVFADIFKVFTTLGAVCKLNKNSHHVSRFGEANKRRSFVKKSEREVTVKVKSIVLHQRNHERSTKRRSRLAVMSMMIKKKQCNPLMSASDERPRVERLKTHRFYVGKSTVWWFTWRTANISTIARLYWCISLCGD